MLSLIACIGKHNELGRKGGLCFRIREDLQLFKRLTEGHSVIMGYNTFMSLNGGLKKRKNYVLTHQPLASIRKDDLSIIYTEDFEGLVVMATSQPNHKYYVIGGAKIYEQFIGKVDEMILTHVNQSDPDADVFFPKFNDSEWKVEEVGHINSHFTCSLDPKLDGDNSVAVIKRYTRRT